MANRERDFIGDKRLERGRFYAPYDQTEEYHAGMWRTVNGEDQQSALMAAAVRLMRDPTAFDLALRRVVSEWPVSCRQEFTRYGNQLAWFGQAACCLSSAVPEALTRRAWWKLSESEREIANEVASSVLDEWQDTSEDKSDRQLTLLRVS